MELQFHPDSAWKQTLPVPNVEWKTPDDGQRRCPKHVEFYNRIIWIISASVWLFKKKSVTMHGNMNVMGDAIFLFYTSLLVCP